MRREVELGNTTGRSGVGVTVTRKGIEVYGWYDSIVGMEPVILSWDELDNAKALVHMPSRAKDAHHGPGPNQARTESG